MKKYEEIKSELIEISKVLKNYPENIQPKVFEILVNNFLGDDNVITETKKESQSENNITKIETKKNTRTNSNSKSTTKTKETVSLDKDLNLKPQSKKHFKDFYEEKNPSSAMEFNTVALYYLAEILEMSNISQNHIYTCYKEVSKKAPNAFVQSLRDTASKNGYIDSSNVNDLKIPLRGKNFVEHDLPKKSKK